MKNKLNIIERTFLYSWPYALVFAAVTYLITKNWDFVLSFVLGTATGLLMNSLNYRVMKNLFKTAPEKIKKTQIWIYIAKIVFYGVILYITNKSDEWNVYFVFVGILTYRIVLYPVALIYAKKDGGAGSDA